MGGRPALAPTERAQAMLEVHPHLRIPETEFVWSYVRSGGPGGQNVNKVASKAVLRWDVASSPSLPADVKARLRAREANRITAEGELVLTSQRYRDQERNRQDCLDKLREMIARAAARRRPGCAPRSGARGPRPPAAGATRSDELNPEVMRCPTRHRCPPPTPACSSSTSRASS
jgi:ribosome-associated protein